MKMKTKINLPTIGPEHQVICMLSVVAGPEPVAGVGEVCMERVWFAYQKKSFRVSFGLLEIGIKPDQEGPASQVTIDDDKLSISLFDEIRTHHSESWCHQPGTSLLLGWRT
jgi:hypothetical protein